MRFAELYPTDFHFMLRMLSTNDDDWDHRGRIVCTYKAPKSPLQLTATGWKSAQHVIRCPTSWPEPCKSSPILNIPDNAEESWLHEISMFVYHLEKWDEKHVKTWISTNAQLSGMDLQYQLSQIKRNYKGYDAVREAVLGGKVYERITLIRNERIRPKIQQKPVVEVSATVRFHTGVDEALVTRVFQTADSRYSGTGSVRMASLDREINGCGVHFVQNLVATKFPTKQQ